MIAPDAASTLGEAAVRLLAAAGIGGIIGLNRELTRKPAGLRTHSLVALGSALATVTALQLGVGATGTNADATSRVIQGVIAGIGFIGGGVILHSEGRNVYGLTTAATILVAAALGVSCGVGQWRVAGLASLIALAVLVLGRGIESALHRHDAGNTNHGSGSTP
jgi:putative Mg2+ transporter-C (MgtC) family protein